MVVGFRHAINYSEKEKHSFPAHGVLHKKSAASSAAKKIQVRQQENLSSDKGNADCGEAAEFPLLETFKTGQMNKYVLGRRQVYLILPSGVTSQASATPLTFQAQQSPRAAVNPSPGLSLGALEISMGNVTFLSWQGFSCQPAVHTQAEYESYLGITHMHLVKTLPMQMLLTCGRIKKWRYRELISIENTKGTDTW